MARYPTVLGSAPLRLSFGGGGTDLREFYSRYGGLVVGSSLTGGVLVWLGKPEVLPRSGSGSRRSRRFSVNEDKFATCVFRHFGISDRPAIVSFGSVEAGTGLGSSAAYLVALTAAANVRYDLSLSSIEIARHAYTVERDLLGRVVGLQDQYLSALGGQHCLRIRSDGEVEVEAVELASEELSSLSQMISFFYAGQSRDSEEILALQDARVKAGATDGRETTESLLAIRDLAEQVKGAFEERDFVRVGRLLDKHWKVKRGLSDRVSSTVVDEIYTLASTIPSFLGGKLSGAGGGGFFVAVMAGSPSELTRLLKRYGYRRWDLGLGCWGAFARVEQGEPLPETLLRALETSETVDSPALNEDAP